MPETFPGNTEVHFWVFVGFAALSLALKLIGYIIEYTDNG